MSRVGTGCKLTKSMNLLTVEVPECFRISSFIFSTRGLEQMEFRGAGGVQKAHHALAVGRDRDGDVHPLLQCDRDGLGTVQASKYTNTLLS